MTLGLEVLVQLVIAAITTWPWSSSTSVPSARVTEIASWLRVVSIAVPLTAGRGLLPASS